MKHRVMAALLMVAALVPSIATGAEPADRASALRASADHLDGTVGFVGETIVYASPGSGAEVSMPPQTGAAHARRDGGTGSVLGETITYRRVDSDDYASGNLRAGTAVADSRTQAVEISVMGTQIRARSVRAVSRATCDGPGTAATAAAGSHVTGLEIGGEETAVSDVNQVAKVVEVGDHFIEVSALDVRRSASGEGWTTTGLLVRVRTVVPLPSPFKPSEVTTELRIGEATTRLTCVG